MKLKKWGLLVDTREIEKKYVVEAGLPHIEVDRMLRKLLNYDRLSQGLSKDVYWAVPKGSRAAFARLRHFPDGTGQLTVKVVDKKSNVDRIEINLELDSEKAVSSAQAYMTHLLGYAPLGSVEKLYRVLWLANGANVSTYRVVDDHRLFLEIEAPELQQVDMIAETVGTHVLMRQEPRSLFEIFIKGEGK